MIVFALLRRHKRKEKQRQQQEIINQQQRQIQQLQQQQQQGPVPYAVGDPATALASSATTQQNQNVYKGKVLINKAFSAGDAEDLDTMKRFRVLMESVYLECEQGIIGYNKSIDLHKKASKANKESTYIENSEVERTLQIRRENELKAALAPAERASQSILKAFSTIPISVRQIYPEEMKDVGQVPVSTLAIGSFGKEYIQEEPSGKLGYDINKTAYSKKIRANEERIDKCIKVVERQMDMINKVIKKMDKKIKNLQKSSNVAVYPPVQITNTYVPSVAYATYGGYQQPNTQLPSLSPRYEIIADHNVDENSEIMRKHGIIQVFQGDIVSIIKGNLNDGLGAPYHDYVEVRRQSDGKAGKVSRKMLRPI